jgi:hypothetical protein
MRRGLVTGAALVVFALTALGGVAATEKAKQACLPPAVIQALS